MAKTYTVTSITERIMPLGKGGFATHVEVGFETATGQTSTIAIPKEQLEKITPEKARDLVAARIDEAVARINSILSL